MTGIENPQLDEMRERLTERLEAEFALVVIDPDPIEVPGDQGSVFGQVQARDGSGGKLAFYLRPRGATPRIPTYVSRLSRATYSGETGVRVCVVLDEPDADAEDDARACGAGLLVLTADSLTQVVEPTVPTGVLNEGEFQEFADDVRRTIIRTAELRLTELQTKYHGTREVTDPGNTEAQALLRDLKKRSTKCEAWRDKLVKNCDNATRRGDRDALEELNQKALNDDPDG